MILSYTHDICIVELIESHTIKFSYSTLLTQQRNLEGVEVRIYIDNVIVRGQTEERTAGPPLCPLRAAWLLVSWPRKEVELACACAWARKQVEPGEERKTTNGRNSGEWWSSLSACV